MRSADRRSIGRESGLTAIEMLIAMAVAAILLGIGVPSFSGAMLSTRLSTQASDLFGALQRARSEAITRATPVTLCKSANATSCTSSGSWESGWIVFVDGNANSIVDSGESVIRATAALIAGYTLRSSATFNDSITFKADGSAQGAGHFILCRNSSTDQARGVNINLVGRITTAPDANGNGIPEDDADVDYTTCTP